MIGQPRAGGECKTPPSLGRLVVVLAVATSVMTCAVAAYLASQAEAQQAQEWKTTPVSNQPPPPKSIQSAKARPDNPAPPVPVRTVKRKPPKPTPVSVDPSTLNAEPEAPRKTEPVEVIKAVNTSEAVATDETATGRTLELVREFCISSKEQIVEARLRRQKAAVVSMTEELKAKISELENLVEESKARADQLKSFSAAISKQIVSVYEGMEPDAAAKQIAGLDPVTGASIIAKLDGQRASSIVSEMSAKEGARIMSYLTQLARMSAPPAEQGARAGQQQ